MQLLTIIMMSTIALAISRQSSTKGGGVVMAWSSSSYSSFSFAPSTTSRAVFNSGSRRTTTATATVASSSSLSSSMSILGSSSRRSQITMWGEEDAPSKRPSIPSSSQFSTDGRPRRPARRSRPSSNEQDRGAGGGSGSGGGWDNNQNNDNSSSNRGSGGGGGWYEEDESTSFSYRRRTDRPSTKQQQSSNDSSSSSSWDNDWGSTDTDTGGSSYEPYTYQGQGRPSNNRGRGGGGGGNNNRRRSDRDGGRGGRGGRGSRGRGERDSYGRGRGRGNSARGGGGGRGRGGGRGGYNNNKDRETIESGAVKINLKMIENAGYQHLYGIAPVLNALKANVRDFTNKQEREEEVEKEELLELQERLAGVDGLDENDDDDDEDDEFSMVERDDGFDDGGWSQPKKEKKQPKIIKPEAALSPHLFVQSGSTFDNSKRSFRSVSKQSAISEIIKLAESNDMELPVVEVDKGVLNTLCGNRPHQGFVLRCGSLDFTSVGNRLPAARSSTNDNSDNEEQEDDGGPMLWLALDEVVDPQNLGALLRSAYFLGNGPGTIEGGKNGRNNNGKVGILVCSKNSSPLTPAVSAASAGALEFTTVYSTSNLPRLLNNAKEDGWRVLGAAAEVPDQGSNRGAGNRNNNVYSDENEWDLGGMEEDEEEEDSSGDVDINALEEDESKQQCFELHQVETGKPTILVLGSEGRGLRTLVARACTGFVSVPGGGGGIAADDDEDDETQAGVDSLNVSVTGGILLWHFLSKQLS